MWTIEQLEEIRDACLVDLTDTFPERTDELVKPRIEINHRSARLLARYSSKSFEVGAYLLSGSTTDVFFRTLFMKGLVKTCFRLKDDDFEYEETIRILQDKYPGRYEFEDLTDIKKNNIELPAQREISYKYAVHCPQCGEIFRFKRICKTVLSPEEYICAKCKVSLERL